MAEKEPPIMFHKEYICEKCKKEGIPIVCHFSVDLSDKIDPFRPFFCVFAGEWKEIQQPQEKNAVTTPVSKKKP